MTLLKLVPRPEYEYEIDRGIPMPPRSTGAPKYPWNQMKVGDSFFVNGDQKAISCVRAAKRSRQSLTGEKYETRKKENGVRVWRVK